MLRRYLMLSLLVWIGLWPPHAARGQPATSALSLERLDNHTGLSHNSVFAVLQDRRGFLWIGTQAGLNRYDGYEFLTYRSVPGDSTSLSHNQVRSLLEDEAGYLWVGTVDGLNRFDPATGTFSRYVPDDHAEAAFHVEAMALDTSGALWIQPRGDRLYWLDRTAGRFRSYLEGGKTQFQLGTMLCVSPAGALWAVTQASYRGEGMELNLLRYDAGQDRFESFPLPGRHPRSSYTPQLHTGPSGTLWLGLPTSLMPEEATPGFKWLPDFPDGGEVHRLLEDRRGILWVGTSEGFYRYDPRRATLSAQAVDTSATAWLSNSVQTLYEDQSGTVWIGTLDGLYRYDPHQKPFVHIGPGTGLPRDRGGHSVTALYEDAAGLLWIGTLGGGLLRLDRATGELVRYRHHPDDPSSLPTDIIWALHEDREGTLWLGGKLCAFDPTTGHCTRYDLGTHSIAEAPDGTLWLTSYTVLTHFDPRSRRVLARVPNDLLDGAQIRQVHVDQQGRLWVGTESGLFIRAPENNSFRKVQPTSGPELLSTNVIHEDTKGVFWLGTRLGLARFDPSTSTLRYYSDIDWPGTIIYSILEDDQGRLWLGTNQGLVRFDKATGHAVAYDLTDGIGNVEFNQRAAFRNARGELFFGGLDGVTSFMPEAIKENTSVPPIALTRVFRSSPEGTQRLNPFARQPLIIEPQNVAFEFEFTALSFTNPVKNQYAYRLEGFDEDWVQSATNRRARYTHVPPGDYVFRVKGTNNDGVWNEEGVALQVTVRPAYWQTW